MRHVMVICVGYMVHSRTCRFGWVAVAELCKLAGGIKKHLNLGGWLEQHHVNTCSEAYIGLLTFALNW